MSFGRYSIRSKKGGKYITIKDNQYVLYEKNPSMQQTFELVIKQSKTGFMDPKSKKYMTLSQCSDQNGAPLINSQPIQIGQQGQYFEIHSVKDQSAEVVIFTFSGKCLDCCEESTKNGTQIIQWDFHGSDNQKWIFEKS